MDKSIAQDMAYRQSLTRYAEKYGVSRASRKHNKSRSHIYFWKKRWDRAVESLVYQSWQHHSHPNQHAEAELKLIRDMRCHNPNLGMVELCTGSQAAEALLYALSGEPERRFRRKRVLSAGREEAGLHPQSSMSR